MSGPVEQGAVGGVADVLAAHGLFGHAHLVAALQSLLDAERAKAWKEGFDSDYEGDGWPPNPYERTTNG